MKQSTAFMANHSVDFKSITIESTDILTELTKKIKLNPTVDATGNQTVGYLPETEFANVWFELKTTVVGVTAVYNSATGDLEVTKGSNWIDGDTVGVLYSVYTTESV